MELINFSKKRKETLNELIGILLENIPEECLDNVEKNLEKTDIIYENLLNRSIYTHLFAITGEYFSNSNKIILHNSDKFVLSHELLHLASYRFIKDSSYCGFSVYEDDQTYYNGLNEGFTEVLNCQIFDSDNISYQKCVAICYFLKSLCPSEREIEIAYFNNNVDYIFDNFLQYGDEEDLDFILATLDDLAENSLADTRDLRKIRSILGKIAKNSCEKEIEDEYKYIKKYIR